MNVADPAALLREIDFFDGVAEEPLRRLASLAEVVQFPEGRVVFREGDSAETVYLIVAGEVALENCAPGIGCRRTYTVGPGELLGWSPILGQPRYWSTARALKPAEAVQFSGRQVMAMCEHDPQFGYEFMRRAAQALVKRLASAQMQLLDLFGPESKEG